MSDIRINGDVWRSFIFPARLATAFDFYTDMRVLIGWLKHIALVREYAPNRLRLLYHTVEMGLYGVSLYCDVDVDCDRSAWIIRVRPLDGQVPVASHTSVQNLTASGIFSSESIFHDQGDQTQIDYHLHLEASLPIPFAAQVFIPKTVLGKVAQAITAHRIDEIADEFIERSLAAFGDESKPA